MPTASGGCCWTTTPRRAAGRADPGRRHPPAWVGAPVFSRDGVNLYPVCVEAGDTRCGGTRRVTRREAWLTAAGIFAVALPVRVVAAAAIDFPRPEDTAYYVGVARNLVEGRGLVSDALWSYGTPPLVFPRPAFEVWLPLPTLLFAIPLALTGAGPSLAARRASQSVTVLLGALLAVLAWRLAADVAAERGLPVAAPGRSPWARAHGRRVPAAGPRCRPARLDGAVRRPRAGRVPAHDARAARPARRAPRGSAAARPRAARGRGGADPERGGLARADLGVARVAAGRDPREERSG